MTKRYNMFNYIETWAGILLICIGVALIPFIILVYLRNDMSVTFFLVVLAVVCLLVFTAIIPNGIKIIKEGKLKAFNCDPGILYGRIRADESNINHIVRDLDCIKALSFCNGKGCTVCPFRISCRHTNFMWMFLSARNLFDKMKPCNEINRFAEIIDRYRLCKESCCNGLHCPDYVRCLESQSDDLQKEIYSFFISKGYTSANQLRS